MIDSHVIKARKLQERLKEVFTSQRPAGAPPVEQRPKFEPVGDSPAQAQAEMNPVSAVNSFPENPQDWQIREFFEQRFRSRLDEGMKFSLQTYRMWQAVDMAIDGPLVNQVQLPLGLLAQGFITLDACHKEIESLSPELASTLFQLGSDKKPIKVNGPRLFEVSHNLVKSLVTRRVAAISTPIRQRHPLMKYEPRDTSLVGQLKGDMMSQYAEIMADNYGYRDAIEQSARDVSKYTEQIEFIKSPWDRKTQTLRRKKENLGAEGVGPEGTDYEEYEAIEKEGLDWVAPHRARVYSDRLHPLRKINSDTGPQYIGYWDISRIGELRTNKSYWNREAIEWDTGLWTLMAANQSFFRFYYREAIAVAENYGNNPGLRNDRKNQAATGYEWTDDAPVTLAYHFEKINPKTWGIADYDHDVWIRFVIAGNAKVIWADVCASTPAVCHNYNADDQRDVSSSFAMDVLPYQDQVSNLLTQLLEIQHQGLVRMYSLNIDGMKPDQIDAVEKALKNQDYTQAHAIIIKYSAEAMRDMAMDARSAYQERLKSIEVSTTEKTTEIFRSIMNLLSLSERLLFFSPQELGQVAPREITATEANMVNNTTLGIRDFHACGLESALDAKKRIIYESAIAFGSDKIELPVMNTYSRATVEKAKFTITGVDSDEDVETVKSGRFTLSGSFSDLAHNFVFTSRDGTERAPDKEIAQSMVQFVQVIGQYPPLGQTMTIGQGSELLNAVARRLGVPVKVRLPVGMDPNAPLSGNPQEQFQQFAESVHQAIAALAKQTEQTHQAQQAIAQSVEELSAAVQQVATKRGQIAPGFPQGTGAPPLPTTQAEQPAFLA
ncbi:MAG: hypothetical protein NDI75_15320 [Candidatus Didemnitutus sp.]|nr:hypothetical protein [Candidatus Didemnitutus sp.]